MALIKIGDEWVNPEEVLTVYENDEDDVDDERLTIYFKNHKGAFFINGTTSKDLDQVAMKINGACGVPRERF